MNIIQMPTNNFFPNTGKKAFLILHGTAGGSSASGIANYFKSTEGSNNPVSSHYIVDQAGVIIQCVQEKDGAYGNGVVTNANWLGNPNYYTISIEHVKQSTDNSDNLTSLQKNAAFDLIYDICVRNGIAMKDADEVSGITGHFAIDPINRSRCPGTYPWNDLWAYLLMRSTMNSPTPGTPSSHQLKAALDCWNSKPVFFNNGTNPWQLAPTGTGIYNSWLKALLSGKEFGPPLTPEYASVDWNGNRIIVQEFARARCEWQNGAASWYSLDGSV